MAVGGGDGVNLFALGVGHHVEELGIDVRLALEVENEVQQFGRQFVYHVAEEIGAQVPRGPGEGAQAAGAFRAAKVAGGGGFYGYRNGQAPLHRAPGDAGHVIGCQHLEGVGYPAGGEFGEEIYGIMYHQNGSRFVPKGGLGPVHGIDMPIQSILPKPALLKALKRFLQSEVSQHIVVEDFFMVVHPVLDS